MERQRWLAARAVRSTERAVVRNTMDMMTSW